jgi:hypothetical protein
MNVTEPEVQTAIDGLKRLSLAMEASSSRVTRYEHNMNRVLGIPSQAAALLTIMLLRGPQTAAELRLNVARLHSFADNSSVEAFLDELAARTPALAVKLPCAPGERGNRWMHLMCGEVSIEQSAAAREFTGESVSSGELETMRAEQKRLSAEVAELRLLVERLAAELGVSVDRPAQD